MRHAIGISMGAVVMALTLLFIAGMRAKATTGTEIPYGDHFDLRIVGISKGTTAGIVSESVHSSHSLYVPLDGRIAINLLPGTEFSVIEPYGADGRSAKFSLPVYGSDKNGVLTYAVWIGIVDEQTVPYEDEACMYLEDGAYCQTHNVLTVGKSDKNSFTNVASQLLYVYADPNKDGTKELYPLFDAELQDLFWSYDNTGSKVAMFKFYLN